MPCSAQPWRPAFLELHPCPLLHYSLHLTHTFCCLLHWSGNNGCQSVRDRAEAEGGRGSSHSSGARCTAHQAAAAAKPDTPGRWDTQEGGSLMNTPQQNETFQCNAVGPVVAGAHHQNLSPHAMLCCFCYLQLRLSLDCDGPEWHNRVAVAKELRASAVGECTGAA
eukprot:GHUV01030423.1.p1 GENE.GHUV01030423.1~~GHUV01030423.1.p1  ORF type:complete len:166 (-),score=20.10 GHUV01030423.1:252-749(-)